MTPQLLEQLGHKHGILSAGNADRNPVTVLYHLILVDGLCEFSPDFLAELFYNAAFHILCLDITHLLLTPYPAFTIDHASAKASAQAPCISVQGLAGFRKILPAVCRTDKHCLKLGGRKINPVI